MSMVSFKNVPFKLGDFTLHATQASVSESAGFQRVEALGYSSVSTVASERVNGEFSAEFYLPNNVAAGLTGKMGGLNKLNGQLGSYMGFVDGYLTEFSFSIEPYSLVSASVKGVFFSAAKRAGFTPILDPGAIGNASNIFAHGARSYITGDSNFTLASPISATLSFTQSVSPSYQIGTDVLLGVRYEGGEIKASVEGRGLQEAVDLCGTQKADLKLRPLCESTDLASFTIANMKITNSTLTVDTSNDLVGSIELTKFI